jgi:hypothetical protein
MRILLPFVALAGLACSSGGSWRKIDTPHFVLRTDLSSSDAKDAAIALESTRDALVSAAWPKAHFKEEQTEVYVLANGLDFERYFGKLTAGLFLHDSPAVFFLYGTATHWELRKSAHVPTPSVLRHEMAHQLSAEVWPHQPLWFAEGLANFLEPVFYSDDEKYVVLGGVNFQAYREYRGVRTATLEDAIAWKTGLSGLAQREAAGLYGISWLFVHWLYNTHPKELTRYLEELERGSAPDVAFEAAMEKLDLAVVNRELFEYQKHGQFEESMRPLVETPLSADALRDRKLDASEVTAVKEVLDAASKRHMKPSHEGPSSDESSAEKAAAPRKAMAAIDYNALPVLTEYQCRAKGGGASPGGDDATVPAKTTAPGKPNKDRPATGGPGVKGAGGNKAVEPEATGKLAPEVIQRIVRASYGTFRKCYEDGLKKQGNLGGRVGIRFVIERDGSVGSAEADCPTLPDHAVIDCIVKAFGALRFPQPSGGIVRVVYPIMYSPAD